MVNYMCVVLFASSSALAFAYKRVIDPRSYPYSNTLNNQFIFPKTWQRTNHVCLCLFAFQKLNTRCFAVPQNRRHHDTMLSGNRKNSHHLTWEICARLLQSVSKCTPSRARHIKPAHLSTSNANFPLSRGAPKTLKTTTKTGMVFLLFSCVVWTPNTKGLTTSLKQSVFQLMFFSESSQWSNHVESCVLAVSKASGNRITGRSFFPLHADFISPTPS